jgi:hypothetical protein
MKTQHFALCAAVLAGCANQSHAAENGLGEKPYLGWSSWSLQATKYPGYGGQSWLNAEHVKQQSDAMAAKLQKHGYRYINMDSGWRGGWDEFGRPAPDTKKFPRGILDVANYVHAKGQKLGIYYVPGIDDDVLKQNPIIKGTNVRLQEIVFKPQRIANAWGGGHAIDYTKPGAHEYIQSIADLFAAWQIDFLKFDGVTPGSQVEDPKVDARADADAWGKALLKTKRPIWYTLSWKIDMRYHEFWKRYANALRVTQDVESYDEKLTHWAPQIGRHFEAAQMYSWAAGKGKGWNDLDSLLVGNGEMSGLTPDERRSVMTLWAIACSPLYSGDDLTKLDALGMELLTNDEVIAVQQRGNVAKLMSAGAGAKGQGQIWAAQNEDGNMTVALFNHADEAQSISATWQVLGLRGPARVRDLWARRDIGGANGKIEATLAPHACRLLEVIPMAGPR